MLEKETKYQFPAIYKEFYQNCGLRTPKNMIGSDLYNKNPELKEWANELLKENNVENQIKRDSVNILENRKWEFKLQEFPVLKEVVPKEINKFLKKFKAYERKLFSAFGLQQGTISRCLDEQAFDYQEISHYL